MPSYQTPGPNAYDTRKDILDPKKGCTILERRKPIEYNRADPKYPDFKDDFEKIVINAQKTANIQKQLRIRVNMTENYTKVLILYSQFFILL